MTALYDLDSAIVLAVRPTKFNFRRQIVSRKTLARLKISERTVVLER